MKKQVTIQNSRACALAWWRSVSFEFKRGLMSSGEFNDSRFRSPLNPPSVVIERIFIKWLEADRGEAGMGRRDG